MKTEYLGKYNRPDGYNGDVATIHAVYDPIENEVIAVHPGGVYTIESCIPTVNDGMETLEWMKSAYGELN